MEGKAEEVENMDKKGPEEEATSGKREVEGRGERIEINSERVCFSFCSRSLGILAQKVMRLFRFQSWEIV